MVFRMLEDLLNLRYFKHTSFTRWVSAKRKGRIRFYTGIFLLCFIIIMYLRYENIENQEMGLSNPEQKGDILLNKLPSESKVKLYLEHISNGNNEIPQPPASSFFDMIANLFTPNRHELQEIRDCTTYIHAEQLKSTSKEAKIEENFSAEKLVNSQMKKLTIPCTKPVPQLISKYFIPRTRDTALVVPNIVHYIHLANKERPAEFAFLEYVSFLSVNTFQKPIFIYLHADTLPQGEWWDETLNNIPNIFHIKLKRTKDIFGQRYEDIKHLVDFLKVNILLEFGGIFLDTDTLLIRSLKSLQDTDCVMSMYSPDSLSTSAILAVPKSSFLQVWRTVFYYYDSEVWNDYSLLIPMYLYRAFPNVLYLAGTSLVGVLQMNHHVLFTENLFPTWQKNHAIHLYGITQYKLPHNKEEAFKARTPIATIVKFIYEMSTLSDDIGHPNPNLNDIELADGDVQRFIKDTRPTIPPSLLKQQEILREYAYKSKVKEAADKLLQIKAGVVQGNKTQDVNMDEAWAKAQQQAKKESDNQIQANIAMMHAEKYTSRKKAPVAKKIFKGLRG